MNKGIAHVLRDWLALPFLTKRAGLVQTQLKSQPVQLPEGGVRNTIKKFPVSCDVLLPGVDCDAGKLIDLVPDSKQSGIIYFEDQGVNTVVLDHSIGYSSKLRLVVWYDTRSVVPYDSAETINCWDYSTLLMQQILDIFRDKAYKSANGIYKKIKVNVERILPSDATIFSKYSYDEENLQYLMHPFDFFAMDLTVNYEVSSRCLLQIKKEEVVC